MSDLVEVSRGDAPEPAPEHTSAKKPFYPQLLRLRHIHPNAWQRAFLGEGMALLGGLLAMADLASAWSILGLPLAVGVVVKCHDLLAGALNSSHAAQPPADERAEPER